MTLIRNPVNKKQQKIAGSIGVVLFGVIPCFGSVFVGSFGRLFVSNNKNVKGIVMLLSRSLFVLLAILLVPSPIVAQVTFSQIAITGGEAPGVDGAEFGGFNPGIGPGGPAINASGDVAFKTLLTGTGPDVQAIFGPTSGAGSPLGLLAQEGVPAPGVEDGAELSLFFNHLSLNASGDVAFLAFLGSENIPAIFGPTSGAGSPLGPIVQARNQAPGMDGRVFSFFGFPAFNASGDIAFEAGFFSSRSAVFGPTAGAGSPLGPIAQQDEVAPGVDDGAVFGPLTGEFFELSLNASGDVAFGAILRTEPGFPFEGESAGSAIFGPTAGAGSPLGLIVRSGDPAPGVSDGAVFGGQNPSVLNDSGDVVISAFLRTGTGNEVNNNNDTAIFGPTAGAGSPLGLIVRENTPAPGVDDGATFDNLISGSRSLNASGDIAFVAALRTGTGDIVDESNDAGLFTFVDGEFQLVVREGDLFTVTLPDGSSTEDRTIASIVFSRDGMNDAGTLVFSLNFTNDTQGIFIADFSVLLGDVNRDGVVNFLDIAPFVSVLSRREFQAEADINEDGEVNFLDIAPFIFFLAS